MGLFHSYETLSHREMNFFQRIIFRWKYNHTPQITLVRKRAMDYAVLTRKNKRSEWEFRELMKNKHADQAMKLARSKYPGYVFYLPKEALRKAAASLNANQGR